MSEIVIVGLNHRTAPVEVRERLAFPADTVGHALRGLRERDGIAEGVILSTCNRVEVCVLSDEGYKGVEHVKDFLAEFHGVPVGALSDHLYHHLGEEAVRHLFRVASQPRLDGARGTADPRSGEGRLRVRLRVQDDRARSSTSFFTKAFSVAKRVRTETRVANSAVSVSYAAVELAKKILGDLPDKTVMLIGAGEMCELAARHLLSAGAQGDPRHEPDLRARRSPRRGVRAARPCASMSWPTHLKRADIILSSTGSPHFILKREDVEAVIRIRRNRPMFFIDMAVPRDIDPDANEIDNVYVYDIDDLNNVIETNLEERQREAELAEEIVVAEVAGFRRWLDSQQVTPTIVSLRRKFDEVRQAEVAKALSALGTSDPKTRKVVESLASSILNKVLHSPIASLKREADGRSPMEMVTVVREIFDLPEEEAEGAPEAAERSPGQGGSVGGQ